MMNATQNDCAKPRVLRKNVVCSSLIALAMLTGANATYSQALAPAPAANEAAQAGVPVAVTGRLKVIAVDDERNHRVEIIHIIQDDRSARRYQMRFEADPPKGLRSGDIVTVRGRVRDGLLYLAADGAEGSSVEMLAPSAAMVAGEQRTLVLVADFVDRSVSCPVSDIEALMFTDPADNSIDDLYRETSFGHVWFTGDARGPYHINYSSNGCDFSAWADAADAAARADGVNPDAYGRKLYVMPQNGCPASGIADVGGNPSRAWVFHCDIEDVFGHELGHNLGMHHASTPAGEYGDNTDLMGLSQDRLRQVNAPHKAQMGWLSDVDMEIVSENGTYDLAPLEVAPGTSTAPHALKIAKPDTGEYYYLSYRVGLGFDANLISIYRDRLSVHRWDGAASRTYLEALLPDGETFVDDTNGITITPQSHSADSMTVSVGLSDECLPAAPTVTLAPVSQTALAGTDAAYTVEVTNADGPRCTASTFALRPALPPDWVGSLSPDALTLGSGQSGSATLSVTSSASAEPGNYGVTAYADDALEPAHSASDTATYVVTTACLSPPAVTLSPTTQRGAAGATLSYSVAVTNTDEASCRASTFALSRFVPGGWSGTVSPSSLTLGAGENGSATFSVTSANDAGSGFHGVGVQAFDATVAERSTSVNATYEVQVPDNTDTTAPTAPSGLAARSKRKHVNLSWGPSTDNVAVVGYRVTRNGVAITETTDTSYVDRSVARGESYIYQAFAFDAAGNVSGPSDNAYVSLSGGGGGGKGKGKPK